MPGMCRKWVPQAFKVQKLLDKYARMGGKINKQGLLSKLLV